MKALIIESHPGIGASAAAELTAAGHHVARCHPEGTDTFPCVDVVVPGSCPIRSGEAVDVALVVRDPAAERPTAEESAVTCALRAGVPVGVMARGGPDPFEGWTTEVLGDDVVAGCERAIERANHDQAAKLRREVARFLAEAETPVGEGSIQVEVEREDGRARIDVLLPEEVGLPLESIASQVHAYYRKAIGTPSSGVRTVDVSVRWRS